MSRPIFLRPEASQDAEEARDYFDTQRPGLGQLFVEQLQEILERIADMPESYGTVWRNVRAALLRRFTYVVYYRLHADRVEVLAVMQGNRDSSAWRSRS